jgi:hypothetical protein
VQGKGGVLSGLRCRARVMCGAREKGACTFRNIDAALGVQSVHGRSQSVGWGVACRRRVRRPSIGHRRRWPEGPVGEVAAGGLPPTPQSPRVCTGVASGSERGRGGFSSSRHWPVGYWGLSWAVG